MAVIRQFPDNAGCAVCSSLVDLPHENLSDCRRALAKEMDAILARAKRIAAKRREFTHQRLRDLDKVVSKAKPRRKRSK